MPRMMNKIWELMYYHAALPVADFATRIAARSNNKIDRALRGRRLPITRNNDSSMPRLWFHVSSLGEFEQTRPIIEALAERHPSQAAWVSFFSPSGLESVDDYDYIADRFYLPMHKSDLRTAFEAIHPHMIIVVKTDLWPGLVWESHSRNIPVLFVNATLTSSSFRNHIIGRSFQRSFYSLLTGIAAISEEDAGRLTRLAGPEVAITVAGDSKFDRMWQRLHRNDSPGWLKSLISGRNKPLLVAGSTYEQEEQVILNALDELGGPRGPLSILLVPHEPTPERVRWLHALFTTQGWSVQTTSNATHADEWDILILDTVGVLAEAYKYGNYVLVGGSFRMKVHNVVEPAMWGKPILVGPYFANSPEAQDMVANGAIISVHDSQQLARQLSTWIKSPKDAEETGRKAKSYGMSRLGASEQIADMIDDSLAQALTLHS